MKDPLRGPKGGGLCCLEGSPLVVKDVERDEKLDMTPEIRDRRGPTRGRW